MPEKNYYELLEVARSASDEQIRENYRLMLYKYHPDHNQGNEDWAVDYTIQLVEAYKTLSDAKARKLYDFKMSHKLRDEGEVGGLSFLKKRASKEAEKCFQEGVRYYKNERIKDSLESFKKAVQLEPEFTDAAYNLALLAAQNGSHHFALDLLNKAIQSNSKDPELGKLKASILKTFMTA